MKLFKYMILIAIIGTLSSCTTIIPAEMLNARQAYQRASNGPAARLVPADLHKAKAALDRAEESFLKDPESFQTKDLAYVAERKANMAEALASIASQKASGVRAKQEYQTTQGEIIEQTKEDLARSQTEKAEAEAASEAEAEKLAVKHQANLEAEQQARLDAEMRAADAQAELANIVELNEEARGLVITLSGSVVFASNQSVILLSAQSRLNQVAEALMSVEKLRRLIVEGHTDSQGSDSFNMALSQRRAESVRYYLISRGYPADLTEAYGIGEVRPIADNASPEGRSNNRRVEIIVQRDPMQVGAAE